MAVHCPSQMCVMCSVTEALQQAGYTRKVFTFIHTSGMVVMGGFG